MKRLLLHAVVTAILVGGWFVSGRAQSREGSSASSDHNDAQTLLERWLQPDVVIGGALVLLYAGELRGDVKRLKAEQKATADRLQNHYMTKAEIRAELRTVEAKIGGVRNDDRRR